MVHPERLATWGEIAEFLRCDVKTAQRWERERGLPVHRLPGGRRGQVFAYRAELEWWLAGGAANGQPAPVSARGPAVRLNRRWAAIGIAGAVLLLVGWYASRRIPPRGRIAGARMQGEILFALDGEGRILWRHSFEGLGLALPGGGKTWNDFLKPVDFEGSGQPDLIAAVGLDSPNQKGMFLYCFDPQGAVKWQRPVAPPLLDFDGKPFESSWSTNSVLVTKLGQKDRLWLAAGNYLRWESALMRVSATGAFAVHFANAGSIMELASIDGAERLIVAAGVNNAFETVFLALVGEDDPPSMSPIGGPPRYRYENGPTGSVRRYILLPQSEFNAGGAARYLYPYTLQKFGEEFVLTLQTTREPTNVYLYYFDRALTPRRARTTAGFWPVHQQLEKAELLDHPASRCPELLQPQVIRSWTPSEGWREIPVLIADRSNLR